MRIQAAQRFQPLVVAEFRFCDRRFQHREGPVVDPDRHRVGVSVLAAMREGKPGRIGKTARRPVHHLGHRRQGRDGAGADPRHQQQVGKIRWAGLRRGCQRPVQPAQDHVLRANVVPGREGEMRK